MRRALCVLALVVAVTACRSSAPSEATFTSADEAAVRKTLDDYTPLTLAKNWDGIVALYTSDAVRFAPNEPPVQHDAMKAWLEKFPPISAFEAPTDHLDGSGSAYVYNDGISQLKTAASTVRQIARAAADKLTGDYACEAE